MQPIPQADNFLTRHATALAAGVITLLMLLTAILFYVQDKASNTAKDWVVHTYQVTGHLQLLANRLKDAELGQRGHIITGDEEFLDPYKDALRPSQHGDMLDIKLEQHHSIAEEMAILRKLTKDNPIMQQYLDELDTHLKKLIDYWANSKDRRANGRRNNPKVDLYYGDLQMENIHTLFSIMMTHENHLLTQRMEVDKASTLQNDLVTFSGIALFYLIMALSIAFYHRSNKRTRATQQQLIQKLADSNTELERFAYVASHDMQEPLRMIANFSTLIATEYHDKLDAEGKEYLHLVTEAALRMQNMVNDLLEYARIGNDGLRFTYINATEELKHVLDNLSASIQERNAEVTYDPLPNINGNPVQFMRLLQNIIGNSLKYQSEFSIPKIHITVQEQEQFWCFSITDNGIGIPEEYTSQIFEPYKRLHTWQEYKGTGIGLAVCKRIVENHQGRIWVTSKPGRGSTFYFLLPK